MLKLLPKYVLTLTLLVLLSGSITSVYCAEDIGSDETLDSNDAWNDYQNSSSPQDSSTDDQAGFEENAVEGEMGFEDEVVIKEHRLEKTWELTPIAGLYYNGEVYDPAMLFGYKASYHNSRQWALDIRYDGLLTSTILGRQGISISQIMLGGSYLLNEKYDNIWYPYISAAVGYTITKPDQLGSSAFGVEVGAGIKGYFLQNRLALIAEGRESLTSGFPTMLNLKLYAGVSIIVNDQGEEDWDKDGIINSLDGDYWHPEDMDGFEDDDGVPDLDNDRDGIPDTSDLMPDEPEDKDGFEDWDGKPDPDNDQDGVLDIKDGAPNDPEDMDGWQDSDGVPDPDNDHDGILDLVDGAPNLAEDRDGFQDKDGIPDYDNDQDGVPDVTDRAPNDPETMNGYEDWDGVPDTIPKETKVKKYYENQQVVESIWYPKKDFYLEADSRETLKRVRTLLNKFTMYGVELRGYLDPALTYDQALYNSKRQIHIIKLYLIENGLIPERIFEKYDGNKDVSAKDIDPTRVDLLIKRDAFASPENKSQF